MKKYLYVFILLCAMSAHAQSKKEVKLEAERISVSQLIEVAYSEIFKDKQYLIDSSVLQLPTIANIRINAKNHDELQNLLSQVMSENGIVIQKKGKVDYISVLESHKSHWLLNTELISYRPKHRSADYLKSVLASVLPPDNLRGSSMAPNAMLQSQQQSQQRLGVSQQANQMPAMPLVGGADLIVIKAASKLEKEKIEALLQAIDTPLEQVQVEATLIEVGLSKADGSAVAAALQLLDGKIDVSIGSANSNGSYAAIKFGGLQAVVKALTTNSNFRILSTSTINVQNGKQARLQVGSEVPVLGALQYSQGANGGQPVQSVEYRPSGVMLSILPEIRSQSIELQIQQQLSEFVQTQTGVNTSPTKNTREVVTSTTTQDGEIVMIGGLTSAKTTSAKSGLLGFTLSNEQNESRTEILLLVRVKRVERPSA